MSTNSLYVANLGVGIVNTANANLDGTGATTAIFTAGADGSLIRSITVKATGNTTQGMVRLFIDAGAGPLLFKELRIPAVTQTGVVPAFGVSLFGGLTLQTGDIVYASTQNSETFVITIDGLDWTNCACPQ